MGTSEVPIAGVGRAGEGDEGEAGDDGGEQRHAGRPARHGAASDKVGVGCFLPARDEDADADKRGEIGGDDQSVGEVHVSARSPTWCRIGTVGSRR